jgi:hypothetical protein
LVAGTQQASAPKIVEFLAIDLSGFGQSTPDLSERLVVPPADQEVVD